MWIRYRKSSVSNQKSLDIHAPRHQCMNNSGEISGAVSMSTWCVAKPRGGNKRSGAAPIPCLVNSETCADSAMYATKREGICTSVRLQSTFSGHAGGVPCILATSTSGCPLAVRPNVTEKSPRCRKVAVLVSKLYSMPNFAKTGRLRSSGTSA